MRVKELVTANRELCLNPTVLLIWKRRRCFRGHHHEAQIPTLIRDLESFRIGLLLHGSFTFLNLRPH